MNTGETTVLVVEPDLDTQRVYRQRLIHDPDIKLIGICSSIASATALLAQTNCDILFTELNLPDEDGLDFIRRASEDGRGMLAYGTGLGKTATALGLAAYNKQMGRAKRTGIAVPLAAKPSRISPLASMILSGPPNSPTWAVPALLMIAT